MSGGKAFAHWTGCALEGEGTGQPTRALLGALLDQLRTAGLLTAYFEAASQYSAESFTAAVAARFHAARGALQVAELNDMSLRLPHGTPFIRNTISWSSETIAGYADARSRVLPSDTLVSLLYCWNLHFTNPKALAWRLLTAAMAHASADSDPFSSIAYVLKLHQGGYLLSEDLVVRVGLDLTQFLAAHPSPSKALAHVRSASLDDDVERLLQAATGESPRPEGIRAIGRALLGSFNTMAAEIRASCSADEQLVAMARLSGIITLLYAVEAKWPDARPQGLGAAAIHSHVEEIRADLGATSSVLGSRPVARPIVHIMSPPVMVWHAYEQKVGERWMSATHDDRLLPKDVCEHLVRAGAKTVAEARDVTLPDRWCFFGERLMPSISLVLNRGDLSITRAKPFERDDVALALAGACAAASNWSRAQLNDVVDSQYFGRFSLDLVFRMPEYGKAEVEIALVDIHDMLVRQELQQWLHDLRSDPSSLSNLAKHEQIIATYRWFPFGYSEASILLDQAGRPYQAEEFALAAVMLAPDRADFWQSLGVIRRQVCAEDDGIFCLAVAQMIKEGSS